MMESVAASALRISDSQQVALVAVGGVDFRIKIYAETSSASFEKMVELEGHQDWIRGLDFAITDHKALYLASCSQDNKIRLWSFSLSHDHLPDLENLLENTNAMLGSKISSKAHVVTCIPSVIFCSLIESIICSGRRKGERNTGRSAICT
jgi:WD40 repeat protein